MAKLAIEYYFKVSDFSKAGKRKWDLSRDNYKYQSGWGAGICDPQFTENLA